MKYYVKLIMRGAFPSGFDAEEYEVDEETYDKIMDILEEKGFLRKRTIKRGDNPP